MRAAPFAFLLLWSGGFAAAKMGLADAEPLTFLCLRYAMVVALLLPLALVLRPPLPRRRGWLDLVLVGALVQGVYFGGDFLALEWGASAGTVALISALQPILVGLLAPWFAHERTSRRQWLGLAMGLTGAATVILARSGAQPAPVLAILCAVMALFGMTGATLYERRFGGQHLVVANLVQCGTGLALLLPLATLLETMHVHWTERFAASLGYLVVANSLVSISLLLAMLRAGSAASVSAWFFLIPPVAGVVAWLVLGEVMPPLGWAGMALAGVGVAIATRVVVDPSPPSQETNPSL